MVRDWLGFSASSKTAGCSSRIGGDERQHLSMALLIVVEVCGLVLLPAGPLKGIRFNMAENCLSFYVEGVPPLEAL